MPFYDCQVIPNTDAMYCRDNQLAREDLQYKTPQKSCVLFCTINKLVVVLKKQGEKNRFWKFMIEIVCTNICTFLNVRVNFILSLFLFSQCCQQGKLIHVINSPQSIFSLPLSINWSSFDSQTQTIGLHVHTRAEFTIYIGGGTSPPIFRYAQNVPPNIA